MESGLNIDTENYLVVGRAGMDLAPEPAGTGIENAKTFSASLGGSAANIAVGIARLGRSAALLSAVSADPVGEYCINELSGYGVDTALVSRATGEARTSLALSEARLENHHTVIYRNGAADFQITEDQSKSVNLEEYSSLIVTGTAFAIEPSRSAVLALMHRAMEAGLQTVFDIDYRPYSWVSAKDAAATLSKAAEYSEIIVGNDEEFDVVSGKSGTGLNFARKLANTHKARILIYKRGPAGATTFDGQKEFHTGVWPTRPLKPTGAGDSFLAAFVTAFNDGADLREAVLRGSAAASIVVSSPGCAPAMPTASQLDEFIIRNRSAL
jgi:5-dehydro-2-deoxygluconokinase